MIKDYEKFKIVNTENRQIFTIEVNWSDDKDSNECKVLKLTFPDGKTEYMKKDLLFGLLWAIGSPQEQQKMIPLQITKTRWYETVLGIKAKSDIRKGEMINVPVKIPIPSVVDEVYGDIKKDLLKRSDSGLIIPNKS